MLIGEVSERSGVPAKTLRYYEDIELLAEPARTAGGYRDYDEEVLDRLIFIHSAQALGLTLGEIRSVIGMRERGQPPCAHVLDLLLARSAEIDKTIKHLRALKGELAVLLERANGLDPADCDPTKICHLIDRTNVAPR